MSNQDRQDGDGLLQCPFCGDKPWFGREEPQRDAMIRCENDDCPAHPEVCMVTNALTIEGWNTRAAPQPTRDAAEGADESRYIRDIIENAMLTMWNEICADTGCHPLDITQGKGRELEFHRGHWARMTAEMAKGQILKLNLPSTTTPKPAPDAMRRPLDSLLEVAIQAESNGERASKDDKQTWAAHARKVREDVADISIALTAPPDAMRREAEHPMADWINIIRIFGPPDLSDEEFEQGWIACREAIIEILSVPEVAAPVPSPDGALTKLQEIVDLDSHGRYGRLAREAIALLPPPSATGAAEPVGWLWHSQDNIEWQYSHGPKEPECWKVRRPVYAILPVRGDREEIARALIKKRFHYDANIEQAFDRYVKNDKSGSVMYWPECRAAFSDADFFLSLPDQPGAGEREAAIEECAKVLDAFIARCDNRGDAQTQGQIGAALRLARDIRALSRQVPQSSQQDFEMMFGAAVMRSGRSKHARAQPEKR